jgi:photosystem II stability/assembly factor-like uncharacterized protein
LSKIGIYVYGLATFAAGLFDFIWGNFPISPSRRRATTFLGQNTISQVKTMNACRPIRQFLVGQCADGLVLTTRNRGARFRPFEFSRLLACCLTLFITVAIAQTVPPKMFNGLKWRLIGPFRGGRAVAVSGVTGDPTTFYFGGVGGGIWKSIDAGLTWKPIFDSQPVASIGAVVVAPSDPNVIYAGTGESAIREDLTSGNGMYKSTDAGATWTHIGLDDTRQISRIMVDPHDANIVYVGALGHAYAPNPERGVYKSTDAGVQWSHVLDLGPEIGIADLAMCAGSPQILFAAAWHTWRAPWSAYAPVDGPGSGIYRSLDAGKTWKRLEGNGLPAGDWGRVGLAIAPDGKRVYALISVQSDPSKSGLYRSDDGGDTWSLVNSDSRITTRAWYFDRVTVDPNHPDVVYMPNVALYRSEDGGKTISVLRGAPGGDDHHELWVDPKNSASLALASDQGTTISINRGQTWSSWNNQPTGQFYHVTTDNQFPYIVYGTEQDRSSAAVFSRTDHGQITPRDWFPSGESESGYIVVDPHDSNSVYLSGTYGSVARYNRRTGLSQDISPWPTFWSDDVNQGKYRAPWTPALVFSPIETNTLYLGTQFVMKTTDRGLHWEIISPDLTGAVSGATSAENDNGSGDRVQSSEVASNQAPQTKFVSGQSATQQSVTRAEVSSELKTSQTPSLAHAKRLGYGVVFTIAPSPLDDGLIWVGSDTGLTHITRDSGKHWQNITPPAISDWSKISLIEASHFDPAVAYAAVDRSSVDDQTPYLYRTRDYGATWQPITAGFAAPAFLRAIREDPETKGLLFAGTERGVYVSWDDGDHWESLQLNLPVAGVRDLAIHGDDLIAATFGRAFWILDNISPLRQLSEPKNQTSPRLYRPAITVRIDNDSFPEPPLPPEEPTADNPPAGAMIDYFLPTAAASVQLEIFDSQKHLVRTFSSEDHPPKHPPVPVAERWFPKPEVPEKTAGMHRFVWNLAWKSSGGPTTVDDEDNHVSGGPKAAPGSYELRLTVDGKMQTQTLKLVMDPRSEATPEVLAQQVQLGGRIFAETMESRRALAEIASVQKQLTDRTQELSQSKSTKNAKALQVKLQEAQSSIENILKNKQSGAQNDSGLQDANTALASALRVVETSDCTIPSQAIAVYDEASPRARAGIAAWKRFKQINLVELNRQLQESGLAPVNIPEIEEEVEYLVSR